MTALTGWRRTATYLAILITILTILLIALLIASLHGTNEIGGKPSLSRETVIYRGSCDTASHTNLWIHLAINIVSTCVLGSSNFFMQALVAPTRREVDAAHSSGSWVEIGVHSIRNLRFIARRKFFIWFLFSLSSVPLHLVFNGCVLDSKATNGFTLLMVGESFLTGGSFTAPAVSAQGDNSTKPFGNYSQYDATANDIYQSWAQNGSASWERLSTFSDCMHRYNDVDAPLMEYRHVIMVVSNSAGVPDVEWNRKRVLKNTTGWEDVDAPNSLWWQSNYHRSGSGSSGLYLPSLGNSYISGPQKELIGAGYNKNKLDPATGELTMDEDIYQPTFQKMQVQYCLSEKFEAPCRLRVANSLLLVVCIMCAFKAVLCIFTLKAEILGDELPLTTPGDGIASFIVAPDTETKGMCALNSRAVKSHGKDAQAGSRPWKTLQRRRMGSAVSKHLWILSYLLIGSSLVVAVVFLGKAIGLRSIKDSRFEHGPKNPMIVEDWLRPLSLMELTVLANTPQLVLSICYLAYSGLLTRMWVEFEWSSYSVDFKTLRVTRPRGQQRSTYRLQLPYRWSIPLLGISALLHWVYSNCLYVSKYEYHNPEYPYGLLTSLRGLQMSTVAILIGLILSSAIALGPIILAMFRLPGPMVLGGSNSKVISAACHCVPEASVAEISKSPRVALETLELLSDDVLEMMSMRELKWGDVSAGLADDEVGHLAFGTKEQKVQEPIDGKIYS